MKPTGMTMDESQQGPELIFGLVGAVGTDLSAVVKMLKKHLRTLNYQSVELRLSKLLSECPRFSTLNTHSSLPEDERIDALMNAGDALRKSLKKGDAVARLAIGAIREHRKQACESKKLLNRTAFILNSLKHPDEIETLRRIYGDGFIPIAVYAPKHIRIEKLSAKIAKSRHRFKKENYKDDAERLVNKDEKEVGDDFGQNVRDAFPLADVFVSQQSELYPQISRFLDLLFGSPFITPTVCEYGMFHAKAAAARSADLSRQVGSVITTDDGEMIAAGCNEVPKAGGGSVWENLVHPEKDYRDYKLGQDASAVMKQEIVSEIIGELRKANWLAKELSTREPQELATEALSKGGFLRECRVASIIEYGRIVHAEMSAISDAARRGLTVKDATLFCTTFPCHMCARHIIASGIRRVVYIEPYPKSMAKDLYGKSLRVDDDQDADEDAVSFEPFMGVAPKRYLDLFGMRRRKDDSGYVISWSAEESMPQIKHVFPTYVDIEITYVDELSGHIDTQEGGE